MKAILDINGEFRVYDDIITIQYIEKEINIKYKDNEKFHIFTFVVPIEVVRTLTII